MIDTQNRKIHLVIPWFGNKSGGAEIYCWGLANALKQSGYPVEILTTTCKDPFHDWSESHYYEGLEEKEGLSIRRFKPNRRNAQRYVELELKTRNNLKLTPDEEKDWIRNSINSDDQAYWIGSNRKEGHFFFLPYLYGTTYHGLKTAGKSGYIIPCLHNENQAYYSIFDKMFQNAAGCAFLSQPEMEFARLRYSLPKDKCVLIRGGIEQNNFDQKFDFKKEHKIQNDYLLYVGRLVPGKGADLLLDCYKYALEKLGENIPDLVLIGEGDPINPETDKIKPLGYLSDEEVQAAMVNSFALCQPSFYESFSIVLLNSWLHEKPALVNRKCEVLRRHCLDSNGGLWFGSKAEFTEALKWLINNPEQSQILAQNGKIYVQTHFTWEKTIKHLLQLIYS